MLGFHSDLIKRSQINLYGSPVGVKGMMVSHHGEMCYQYYFWIALSHGTATAFAIPTIYLSISNEV